MSGEGSSSESTFKGFSDAEKALIKEEVNQQLGRIAKLFGVVNFLVLLGGAIYVFNVVPDMIKQQVNDNVSATAKARIDDLEAGNRDRIKEALANNQSKLNSSLEHYDKLISKSLEEKSKAIDSLSQVAFASISKKSDDLSEQVSDLRSRITISNEALANSQTSALKFHGEFEEMKSQFNKSKQELDEFAGITNKAVKSDVFQKFDSFSKILDQNNSAANVLKSIDGIQKQIKADQQNEDNVRLSIEKVRYYFSYGTYKFDYPYGDLVRHGEPKSEFVINSDRAFGNFIEEVWAIPYREMGYLECERTGLNKFKLSGRLPDGNSSTYIEVYVAYRGQHAPPGPPVQLQPSDFNLMGK